MANGDGRDCRAALRALFLVLQGTNAHMVLGQDQPPASVLRSPAAAWQKSRYWWIAAPHILLHHHDPSPARGQAVFHADISLPQAGAVMLQHAVNDIPTLPASAVLELATAAGLLLLDDYGSTMPLVIADASLSPSLQLTASRPEILACTVDALASSLLISKQSSNQQLMAASLLAAASSIAVNLTIRPPASRLASVFVRSSELDLPRPSASAEVATVEALSHGTHHLRLLACESASTLEVALHGADALQLRSCAAFVATMSDTNSAAIAVHGNSSAIVSSYDRSLIDIKGLAMAPISRLASADSFATIWTRIPCGSAEARYGPSIKIFYAATWVLRPGSLIECSGAKWLLLSNAESTLASICSVSPPDRVQALCVAYPPTPRQLSAATEVVAGNATHLHALLKAVQVDQTFAVQHPSGDSLADLYHSSLAWAYTAKDNAALPGKISIVTFGQQQVSMYDDSVMAPQPAMGGVAHGLSKTQFMESRQTYSTAIDLQPGGRQLSVQQVLWTIASNEYSVAVRAGQLHAERLIRSETQPRQRPVRLRADAACAISGGTKGLGLECAKQLVRKGARHLVLISRSGTLDAATAKELQAAGT